MSHKMHLLVAGLLLLVNIFFPHAQPEQAPNARGISSGIFTPALATAIFGEIAGLTGNLLQDVNPDGETGVATGSANPAGVAAGDFRSYLPLIGKTQPGIFGKVTENGFPAAGVPLILAIKDGSAAWSTAATTSTSSDGSYVFKNAASLNPGQIYCVLYLNEYEDTSRLRAWQTRLLETYQSGDSYHIGDFDLANIQLSFPSSFASVTLPVTFKWTPRPATRSDSYEFNLFSPDEEIYFYTKPPLGYVDGYTLHVLPPSFGTGTLFGWNVWVYSPDGGAGISYWNHGVYFTNTNRSSSLGAPLNDQPLPFKDLMEFLPNQMRP